MLLKLTRARLKSYEGTESTGKVQILGGDSLDSLAGKNVLVVEVVASAEAMAA